MDGIVFGIYETCTILSRQDSLDPVVYHHLKFLNCLTDVDGGLQPSWRGCVTSAQNKIIIVGTKLMTIEQNQHVKEKYKKIGDTKSANLTDLSLKGLVHYLSHNCHLDIGCDVLTANCRSSSGDSIDFLWRTISTTTVVSDWYIINFAYSWWLSIQSIVGIIRWGNCSLSSSLW